MSQSRLQEQTCLWLLNTVLMVGSKHFSCLCFIIELMCITDGEFPRCSSLIAKSNRPGSKPYSINRTHSIWQNPLFRATFIEDKRFVNDGLIVLSNDSEYVAVIILSFDVFYSSRPLSKTYRKANLLQEKHFTGIFRIPNNDTVNVSTWWDSIALHCSVVVRCLGHKFVLTIQLLVCVFYSILFH